MITRGTLAALTALAMAGCLSTSEQTAPKTDSDAERVREYESRFAPSAEDQPAVPADLSPAKGGETPAPGATPAVPPSTSTEEVPGFRIQLFSTNDFDEAGARKVEAEALFTGEWVYLQYDQPTYKIRIGNFLTRFDAERFRALAIEKGFAKAWIVPERVFKNPAPPSR